MTFWLVRVSYILRLLRHHTSSALKRQLRNIRVGFLCLLFAAEMLCSQVQVLLLALFGSVLLVQVSGAPRRNMLAETLGADLANDKDLAGLLLLKYMSELMAVRGDGVLPKPWEEEEVGVREEVMRRHLPLSQRERKAGCRNFFWKTFTSC